MCEICAGDDEVLPQNGTSREAKAGGQSRTCHRTRAICNRKVIRERANDFKFTLDICEL